jgi:hypothetical protein
MSTAREPETRAADRSRVRHLCVARRTTVRAIALLALSLLLPACIVLHDDAGVDVAPEAARAIEPGRTTRAELLTTFGPPTGHFSTDLLAAITRTANPIEAPATAARLDDDVLTWQSVHVRAQVAFFPVLFAWVNAKVSSRTLMVWLDPDGRVRYATFREDAP